MRELSTYIPPDYRPDRPTRPGLRRRLQRGTGLSAATLLAAALTLAATALPTGTVQAAPAGGKVLEERSTLTEELLFPAAGRGGAVLRVCNISGSVVARGTAGETGRLVVHETYSARTREALDRVQKELAVEISRRGDLIEVSIGGPCEGREGRRDRHDQDDHASARHDMEIEIPHGVEADLRTVNGGEVRLSSHRGPFRVTNVNGGVTVLDVAGSGSATTVNGPVEVRFAESPDEGCRFASVNGEIDLAFPSDLAGHFRFRTLNGEIYTDFPFEANAVTATSHEPGSGRARARYVVKKRWSTAATIGGGGPEHEVNTVNGDVYIRDRSK